MKDLFGLGYRAYSWHTLSIFGVLQILQIEKASSEYNKFTIRDMNVSVSLV
jgi:hypothetical protein